MRRVSVHDTCLSIPFSRTYTYVYLILDLRGGERAKRAMLVVQRVLVNKASVVTPPAAGPTRAPRPRPIPARPSVVCFAQSGDEKDKDDSSEKSFIDGVKAFFDPNFGSWAPKSSQAWRLGGLDSQASISGSVDENDEDNVDSNFDVLNDRIEQQRRSTSGSVLEDTDDDLETSLAQQPSFLKSTDEEFASSLNSRITEVANSASDADLDAEGLDGGMLLNLIEAKFGKKHDVSFVRRDIPGKTLVCLNVYHAYLGQKSFPMSEEDFKEKMEGVALALNLWDQADTVVAFLKAPVRSSRGLPSRPIVGNAVSIPIELTKEQIVEWWGR